MSIMDSHTLSKKRKEKEIAQLVLYTYDTNAVVRHKSTNMIKKLAINTTLTFRCNIINNKPSLLHTVSESINFTNRRKTYIL